MADEELPTRYDVLYGYDVPWTPPFVFRVRDVPRSLWSRRRAVYRLWRLRLWRVW